MKYFLIVLILGIVFLAGCGTPEFAPDNFKLEYGFGSCKKEEVWATLTIFSDGEASIKIKQDVFEKNEEYELSEKEINAIYGKVYDNDFFEMNGTMYNDNNDKGACSYLEIKADNMTNKVEVANQYVRKYESILKKVITIMNDKDIRWNSIDKADFCSRADSFCELAFSYKGISCEEWDELCGYY